MKVTLIVLITVLLFIQCLCSENETLRECQECVIRPYKKLLVAPSCVECMCDQDCIVYGDCCIDVLIQVNLHTITRQPDTGFQCVVPSDSVLRFRHIDVNYFGFYMKTVYKSISNRKQECSREIFPVTCRPSGDTYVNAECAYLNQELDCVDWTIESECSNSTGDVQCATYLVPPEFADLRSCDMTRSKKLISVCKDGFSQLKTELCEKYFYPVYKNNVYYRNIFCYLCNDNRLESRPQITGGGGNVFTALTSFTNQFNRAVVPCDGNSAWLDTAATKCRDINCASDKRLDVGFCLPDNRTAINNTYSIKGLLTFDTNHRIPFMQQILGNALNSLSQSLYSEQYYFTASPQYSSDNSHIVHLQIWFKITVNMSLKEFEEYMLKSFIIPRRIWTVGRRFSSFYKPDLSFMIESPGNPVLKPDPNTGLCCIIDNSMLAKSRQYEPITYQLTCSYIQFSQPEYIVQPNKSALIPHLNLLLSVEEFSITEVKLTVCFELFLNKTGLEYNNETIFYDGHKNMSFSKPLWYVTVACLTVSLISILFTVITYCKFAEMRTQPGINNMFLCVNLFLAQMMLLVGVGRSNQVILCQILGILIHYLWLSMLFWMNVCSYHMFKVFVLHKLKRIVTSKPLLQTFRYIVYGNGTPLLIVGTNIATNLMLSEGSKLGYGGTVCYLSSNMLILYCFVIPLCIIIISNIVLFLSTIITIHRTTVKGKQTAERKNVYIYLKLSVVTGIFWTVSLLPNFIEHIAIDYISVLLNASQGLFLLWSFVLNKLVLNRWKETFIPIDDLIPHGIDSNELKPLNKH